VSEKEAWFAASLLFERTFEGGSKAPPLFEESIVLVRAPEDHESAALKKAVKVGMAASHSYRNIDGETVSWTFKEVLRVVQVFDSEIAEGSEVYSRFLSAEEVDHLRTSLTSPLP
jgi:hypothetical protein